MVMTMDTDSLITRANEEREKIFLKYERGREPGAEIDPWEDPEFSVYSHTDRYGFIHEKKLPENRDPNSQRRRAIELEREKKWIKMLNKWPRRCSAEEHTHWLEDEKLRRRVFKGIPNKLRSSVWPKLLHVERWVRDNEGVYEKMLKLARRFTTEARQVDADVNRQFREHISYRERFSVKQKGLFNVLTAYSVYNTEVGYCQGMAGVAGILLMYMDEEEAFWALNVFFMDEKFAMHGLFIEGFPKLTRFLNHHDKLLERFMPRLKKHFDKNNVDAILYSLKWFFVIFVERVPFSLALRVWDLYLLLGERVMTGMAYTILKLHKSRLMRLRDMDEIIDFLQVKLYHEFGYEDDYVIDALGQTLLDLRRRRVDLPGQPGENERPRKPLGEFVEPTDREAMIGHRKKEFTDAELRVHEEVDRLHRQKEESNGHEVNSQSEHASDDVNDENFVEEDTSLVDVSKLSSILDTSMTSTMEPSLFSGGGGGGGGGCQRSNSLDDNYSIIDSIPEEEDENDLIVDVDDQLNNEAKGSLLPPECCNEGAIQQQSMSQPLPVIKIIEPPMDEDDERDSDQLSVVSN